MPAGVYVCELDEIPADRGKECVAGGRVVALFRAGDAVVAIDGICPHAGGPLAQGMVRGEVVTCPWHGWQYNICSGKHQLNPRICVDTFRASVEDGKVYVEV
jgi:NAD(P)H-dependent nitrite reductase small subunit